MSSLFLPFQVCFIPLYTTFIIPWLYHKRHQRPFRDATSTTLYNGSSVWKSSSRLIKPKNRLFQPNHLFCDSAQFFKPALPSKTWPQFGHFVTSTWKRFFSENWFWTNYIVWFWFQGDSWPNSNDRYLHGQNSGPIISASSVDTFHQPAKLVQKQPEESGGRANGYSRAALMQQNTQNIRVSSQASAKNEFCPNLRGCNCNVTDGTNRLQVRNFL